MRLEKECEKLLKKEVLKRPVIAGARYNWKPSKKPMFWFLTFWKSKWKNNGILVQVPPNSPKFETATYETKLIYNPNIIKASKRK